MKIEIELEEVERLREQLKRNEIHIKELEEFIDKMDEKALYERAVKTSFRLFNDYMVCIFKHLGFDWADVQMDNVRHWLGEHWWDSERLYVEIGANISNKFNRAYMNIGIHTEKLPNKNKDDDKKLDK
jgi:hypothetical protein